MLFRSSISRWGSGGNKGKDYNSRNKDISNEVSYYGPSDNNNDDYRKRKRPLETEPNDSSRRGNNRLKGNSTAPHRVEEDEDDKNEDTKKETTEVKAPRQYKPDFGLSGALAKDTELGNVFKGVVLKFKEPPEARAPKIGRAHV